MLRHVFALVTLCCAAGLPAVAAHAAGADKHRIVIVSSYHREYLWSQDTAAGVNAGLLEAGWLDSEEQAARFAREDAVESSHALLVKLWMDTKRANSRAEIARSVARVVARIDAFRPTLLLLGDDNATRYIAANYLDTRLPVVFWGVNGSPAKYDLIDSMQRPGHNVTGVYQAGYLKEGVEWLRKLLPDINRMAVLSDDSPTGRAKAKELERLARAGDLGVQLVATVVTNSLATWQARALELAPQVDAFFVLNHNTLKDRHGNAVDQLEVGAWYLNNVRKPDIGHERQFVVEGVLCAVDDSGIKQGQEAVRMAWRILDGGEDPAAMAVYAPPRGDFVVNLERARMLGLEAVVAASPLVEARIERALALDRHR
jgi:ABC-type uncharacterized transport system substrate-binding protein